MGLTDQPRAVIFHEKNGREHAHVIWSRTDTEQMRAIMKEKHRRERQSARTVLGHWLKMDRPSVGDQVKAHYDEIKDRKEEKLNARVRRIRKQSKGRSRSRSRGPSMER